MRQLAIVGSGPAGCYAAEHLLRAAPDATIDIIDRLPVPYGLIRAGVAPDHQSTKAVARVLDRVLGREQVGFFGHVEVGRDVTLAELEMFYDAVILATGAQADRRLGVPGEDLAGIHGSAGFVGWYNRDPAWSAAAPRLAGARSVVLIGNGNVALDVARILAKTPAELAGSDLDPEIEVELAAAPLAEIHIVGRRGAADARFSLHELGELGQLERAQPHIARGDLAGEGPILDRLRAFRDAADAAKPVAIRFHFEARPIGFAGADRVESVRFESADGVRFVLPADLVVTCIGYGSDACCSQQPTGGIFVNVDGLIGDRRYVVGWAKRGPSGTIATNRAESHAVAARVAAEAVDGARSGQHGLIQRLAERGSRRVDYRGWQRIDAAERARAPAGRVRRKFSTPDALLDAAS